MADTTTARHASIFWRRLPVSLADVSDAPPVTRYLLQQFHQTMAHLNPQDFVRSPWPRLRVPARILTSFKKQDTAGHWKKMLADRYGEHQCPDMPAYSVLLDPTIPGAIEYGRVRRPFGEKMLLALIAARFDLPGWFEAMKARLADFPDWCRSADCDPWVGDGELCEMVLCMAHFLDMCGDRLAIGERTAILNGAEAFFDKMWDLLQVLMPAEFPLDSHAFSIAGIYAELGCILKAHGRTAAGQKALDYWSRRMMKHWPCFGGKDGGWWMGPTYWRGHLSPIISTMEALKELGGPDLLATAFMQGTGYFKWYIMPPYARAGGFGDDTHVRPGAHDLAIMRYLGVLLHKPEWIAYADGEFEPFQGFQFDHGPASAQWLALLFLLRTWDVPRLNPRPAPTAPSRVFADVGMVGCHTALGQAQDDVMLCFRSGTAGSFGHAHADQNSFFAQAFGEPIFIDAGYYPTYHHPHMKGFAIQTMAHNAVLINNQGQSIRNFHACGQLEHVELTPDYDYVIGECAAAYACQPVLVRRHVWFGRQGEFPMLLTVDHVVLKQPGNIDVLLHSYEEPRWDAACREAEFFGWRVWGTQARARVQILEPQTLYWQQTDEFPYPADGRELHQPRQWHARATTVEGAYEQWMIMGMVFRREVPPNPLYAVAVPDRSPRWTCSAEKKGWKLACGQVRLRLDRNKDRLLPVSR